MEIVKQTPGRLVVVHRSGGGARVFAALCGLVVVGALGLFAARVMQGIGRGSTVEIVICALMSAFMLLPLYLCLNTLLNEQVFDFDRDRDRFAIRERAVFGRKETAGRVSRIVAIDLKVDYSGTSVDTGPSSEVVIRYAAAAGSARRTAACGLGLVDEDRRLHHPLKAFHKL